VPVQEGYFPFAAWDVPADEKGQRLPAFVRWITS